MSNPKWLDKPESTRSRSDKQEKGIVKKFKEVNEKRGLGAKNVRQFANSGARFGENDVRTPEFEIEAKTTEAKQYTVKGEDIKKMATKCQFDKIPVMVVNMEGAGEEVAVMRLVDFYTLIEKINPSK